MKNMSLDRILVLQDQRPHRTVDRKTEKKEIEVAEGFQEVQSEIRGRYGMSGARLLKEEKKKTLLLYALKGPLGIC